MNEEKLGLQKLSFDTKDSAVDEYRQIVQRWEDVTAAEGQSVCENYANGRFALICDLNLSLPGGEFGNMIRRGSPFRKFKYLASAVFVANAPNPLKFHIRDKQPMFVLDVKSVQGPDGFSIPSLVGLYDIHDEVDDPFGGLIFESAMDGCYKFIPGVVHRKLGMSGPLSVSGEFYVVGDEIESGAQIMERVSSDAHELFWHGFTRLELERVVASIRVSLNEDSVRMSVDAYQNTVQISDVLLGPLNL